MSRHLAAFCNFLVLTLLAPMCVAQFTVSDNFNRANGPVGLGWSVWGNGAQINNDELETFGEPNIAGGIQRLLDVTFPLKFSFDFNTATPTDGGWSIGFNSPAGGGQGSANGSEVGVYQFDGSRPVCISFQTSSGQMFQCASVVSGQRTYTATAQISATVNADFSVKVTIEYNDGLLPASVKVNVPSPVGALTTSQGDYLILGNSDGDFGPHNFDNFKLSLM